jgi:hypothetical protein
MSSVMSEPLVLRNRHWSVNDLVDLRMLAFGVRFSPAVVVR